MPSPFPGMNPYLEQDVVWHDFHKKFLPAVAEQLVPQVRPNYIVRLDEHVYVRELPESPRRLAGRGDVLVSRPGGADPLPAGVGLVDAPARVRLPVTDVERVSFLKVQDRRTREVITVVELLSPSNKRPGADREQYLGKRETLLNSPSHLVEIDLLRGGRSMPLEGRPATVYSVLVSRAEDRPQAGFWPLALADRLPTIPIPLRHPDPDACIDLQDVLNRVYDASAYEDEIYETNPEPPLSREEAEWARPFKTRG